MQTLETSTAKYDGYVPDRHDPGDNRHVALIKSLDTNNRFYVLASPESGIHNADTVEEVPDDLLLGIAYPCLEDGLNDFAVIRTAYETLDLFRDDETMCQELLDIINDARGSLLRRLMELIERLTTRKAFFLGADLEQFKTYSLDLVHRGYRRRNLDSTMKVNVFASVAAAEGYKEGCEPPYTYEFRYVHDLSCLAQLPVVDYVITLISDVMDSVLDDDNFDSKYTFDRNIFQKFIALLFINYGATDPMFYGTNPDDYGVSDEKDMENTTLYRAVAGELRSIEARLIGPEEGGVSIEPEKLEMPSDQLPSDESTRLDWGTRVEEQELLQLPNTRAAEEVVLGLIASICGAAHRLDQHSEQGATASARDILSGASRLVQELKRLQIISSSAPDPSHSGITGDGTGEGTNLPSPS